MQLRDYQHIGIGLINESLLTHARVLTVSPTGSGKGTMATEMIVRAATQGHTSLFVAHRREIVLDVADRIRRNGIAAGVILPDQYAEPGALAQVASTQSLLARDPSEWPRASLVITDEAHHYEAHEWRKIVRHFGGSKIVGFTATPQRSDGRGLGDVFETLIPIVTYGELLGNGYIVPCAVLRASRALGIDLAMSPVDAYVKYANGSRALVFTRTVDAAEVAAAEFRKAGIRAECIEANTPSTRRDSAIARLKSGQLRAITNMFTMTEGVDLPAVDTEIIARWCHHESTFVQMAGRVLRPYGNKRRALLLDLCGVTHKHGSPTDERAWPCALDKPEEDQVGPVVDEEIERADPVESVIKNEELVPMCEEHTEPSKQAVGGLWSKWLGFARMIDAGQLTLEQATNEYRHQHGHDAPTGV
jgi:DNA repair protein RadD